MIDGVYPHLILIMDDDEGIDSSLLTLVRATLQTLTNEVSVQMDYLHNPEVVAVCEGVISLCNALDQSVTALFDVDTGELDPDWKNRFEEC